MKGKAKKKGFTIVELVVVIAVIAVLAAVLIPTFSNIIKKAQKSSDTQLVRNLNTALTVDGEEHNTMYDALKAAEKAGYLVDKINATETGNELLWDSVNNCFVYMEEGNSEPTYIPNTKKEDVEDYQLWQIVDKMPATQKYSIYAGTGWTATTVDNLTVGFDAGEKKDITSIKYKNTTAGQDVTIRTNGGMLTIDDSSENGKVRHYGHANELEIIDVAPTSFHANGSVTFAKIADGRIVLEETSNVGGIHLTATENKTDSITIATVGNAKLPELTRDDINVADDGSTLVVTIQKLQNSEEAATEENTTKVYIQGSVTSNTFTAATANQTSDIAEKLANLIDIEGTTRKNEAAAKDSAAGIVQPILPETDESNQAYVAQIKFTGYTNLADAFKASKSGDTIVMLKDFVNPNLASNGAVNFSLKDGVTLDGNGHAIRGNSSVYMSTAKNTSSTVKNVTFQYIHNGSAASQSDCDWYGWEEGKQGTKSAIYASNLYGTVNIIDCTFDNADWDAIQITPYGSATINIIGNTFSHSSMTDYSQLRYIHIEGKYSSSKINVNDNCFYKTKDLDADAICNIGIWYVPATNVNLTGNYFEYTPGEQEVDTNSEVQYGGAAKLFPARSSANVNVDDLTPVTCIGDVAYLTLEATPAAYDSDDNTYATLQDAIDNCPYSSVWLAKDCSENATIPEGKSLTIYAKTYKVNSTITNNGTLTFSINDYTEGTGKIINNGTLKIQFGSYDPNKITNGENGTVIISGGTFTTRPQSDWLAEWYTVAQNEDGSFTVCLMSDEEAIAAGAVARYGSVTSGSRKYFKTVQEGIQNGVVHLLKDVTGESIEKTTGYVDLFCEEYTFTGSITCTGKTLYIDNGTAVLSNIDCGTFYAGYQSYDANVTVNGGKATNIKVAKNATLVINGGTYTGTITVTSGGDASLVINGGTFSVDPTAYVNAETHQVTQNADGTWTVSAK